MTDLQTCMAQINEIGEMVALIWYFLVAVVGFAVGYFIVSRSFLP